MWNQVHKLSIEQALVRVSPTLAYCSHLVCVNEHQNLFKYLCKIFGNWNYVVVVFALRPQKGPAYVTALPLQLWRATPWSNTCIHTHTYMCELIFSTIFSYKLKCCFLRHVWVEISRINTRQHFWKQCSLQTYNIRICMYVVYVHIYITYLLCSSLFGAQRCPLWHSAGLPVSDSQPLRVDSCH